jgi:hypothetical protein
METWLLRHCNPFRSESTPVLPKSEELSAVVCLSEANDPREADSQYVEMVNYLFGFATTLG